MGQQHGMPANASTAAPNYGTMVPYGGMWNQQQVQQQLQQQIQLQQQQQQQFVQLMERNAERDERKRRKRSSQT
jgi:Spy/CpxP family protein refolding chaperone